MTSFYKELHKSDSINDEKENIESRKNIDKWIFRLLLLLIGIIPLIVFAHIENVVSPVISNVGVLTSGAKGELFTHFKALFIVIVTVIASSLLLAKIFFMGGTIRRTFLNYPIAAFTLTIVLSTIMSPNITVALSGLYNRSDGAISWLCYIILMFIAMNIEYPKNSVKYILYTMIPFVVINFFIITMNFYGKDLLQYEWLRSIISMTLPEGGTISKESQLIGTLNQWNYMSGMFAIMTALFLTAAILEKNILIAIGYLSVAIMSIMVMIMSISTSGFLTFSITLLIILFLVLKSKMKIRNLAIISAFFIVTTPLFHILATHNSLVWGESLGLFIEKNPYEKDVSNVGINYGGDWGLNWDTTVYAAEKFELPILPDPAFGIGSGRLYIWDKTIDLVKKRPLLGYGLDTLMYNFPHYNIDTRAALFYEDVITDKPHSLYIGWLYGAGILGFFSAITLVIFTLFKVLKVFNDDNTILVLGIAWIAYLIQGLFNDSLPGTSVVMWIMAGILLAMIFKNKEQLDGRDN